MINNAGVYKVSEVTTSDNLDVRFVVNTIAPYLLTQKLIPLFDATGRIVNLSSAAQSTVDLDALISSSAGKLDNGPAVLPVNPASFLGSKLVKEAYGVDGNDLAIGTDILCRAALSDDFADASGQYFDNDSGLFKAPHADASNPEKNRKLVEALDRLLEEKLCVAPS